MRGLDHRLRMAARQRDLWATVYRRTWRGSVITSFVAPLLFVLSMGVMLGGYVEADPGRLEGATTYLAFVAPGLVAAQTMQLVIGEVSYPVMAMTKWQKTAYAMTATPLEPVDVVNAHLAFVVFRTALASAVFLAVLAPFGVFESGWGVGGAFLVQLVLGLAFATPVYGLAAGLDTDAPFSLVFRLGVIPMFLFSGAFFPVEQLPGWLEVLARVTPLWHGVDLTRMLTLGRVDAGLALLHLGYLVVLAALGWWWAARRMTRRLVR